MGSITALEGDKISTEVESEDYCEVLRRVGVRVRLAKVSPEIRTWCLYLTKDSTLQITNTFLRLKSL